MSDDLDLERIIDQHRRELLAHCYRMLGSFHDAEDAVQETLLRAWRGFAQFEGRSSPRTWLYRIATRVCLTALESGRRRVLPSGLERPLDDGTAAVQPSRTEVPWLEPFPHGGDPFDIVAGRETMRLAFVAALQELPAGQRAALLLRDVVGLPAAEVADLLDLSVPAVTSALQRARAHARRRDHEEYPTMRADTDEAVLTRFIAAFEQADVPALAALLRHDVSLEMPPIPTWFAGRDVVATVYATRPMRSLARRAMPTWANGCPTLACYVRQPDGSWAANSIQVLETEDGEVARIYTFLDLRVFATFGLPLSMCD